MQATRKALIFSLAILASGSLLSADHLDAPLVQEDPAADINDLYAFTNPNDPEELILIATVFPVAGSGAQFSDVIEYKFNILNNGSNAQETSFNCRFRGQRLLCGIPGNPTVVGRQGEVVQNGDVRVFAGLADDPFFFDLAAFNATVETVSPQFNPDGGTDFFDGLNTLTIAVGIKSDLLTDGGDNSVLQVWASTRRTTANRLQGPFRFGARFTSQVDRIGRPAINTALIDLLDDEGLKNAYNLSERPSDWGPWFQDEIAGNLAALDTLDGTSGNALADSETLASILVNDRLFIDTSEPACDAYLAVELGVPGQCGGRTLSRDVIDDTLGAVVGPGVSDFVADTNTFQDQFPFIGLAN